MAVPSATTVPPTVSVKAFDVPTKFSTHTSVHTVPFTVAPAAGLVMKTRGSDGVIATAHGNTPATITSTTVWVAVEITLTVPPRPLAEN